MKSSLKFRLLFTVLATCLASLSFSQAGVWNYVSSSLVAHFGGAAVTGQDGKIYVMGGLLANSTTAIKTLEAYDPGSNSWTQLADMPITGRYDFDAVAGPDGKIYVFGGADGTHSFVDGAVYNPSTNTWGSMADAPNNIFNNLAVLGADGKIYAIEPSQADGGPVGYVLIYDIASDSWATAGSVPADLLSHSAGAVGPDGKLYIVGGYDEDAETATTRFYKFDPAAQTFSPLQDVPVGHGYLTAAWGGDGRLYAISGFQNGVADDSGVDVYNPATNTWISGPNLNTPRQQAQAATAADGSIYDISGGNLSGTQITSVERLIPSPLSAQGLTFSPTEGNEFDGKVATINDLNGGQASDFSATIHWGDGTSSSATVAAGSDADTFDVSGSHAYAEEGNYSVTVDVTDSDTETAKAKSTAQVADADLNATGVSINGAENVSFSGKVASFTDANPLATPADFTATIDWGDATTSSATIVLNGSGGFDVKGTHTYTATGSYVISVQINDAISSASTTSGASITVPPPVVHGSLINATEGTAFNGNVATFTDPDSALTASNFTASIQWGDGTTTTGSVSSDGSGGFNVSGNHAYAEEGTYTLTITVTATGGADGSDSGQASVADAPLIGTGFSLIGKFRSFSGVVAAFRDADPAGVVGDYNATILWGDGGSSAGTIHAASGSFTVSGSHNYLKKQLFTVQVLIHDTGGASTTVTTTIDMRKAH